MIGVLPYLALTMGLMSSFHCIGMCGPIALALPIQKGSKWQQFVGLFIYNSGRALTYSMLGAFIGVFGTSIALMGYLKYVSILAGILMLTFVLWPSYLNRFLHPPKVWQQAINQVKKRMSGLLKSRKLTGFFFLGSSNGLLPCGLVYLALISSVATGSVYGSALYMLFFGLGTLPAMMAVGFFKNWFTPTLRTRFHQITPIFIAVAGIWLLVRGVLIEYPTNQTSHGNPITICHGK